MKSIQVLIAVTLCAGFSASALADNAKSPKDKAAETETVQKKGEKSPGQAKKHGPSLPHDLLITNAPAANAPARPSRPLPMKRGDAPRDAFVKPAPATAPAPASVPSAATAPTAAPTSVPATKAAPAAKAPAA
jgi:hypothetical protein